MSKKLITKLHHKLLPLAISGALLITTPGLAMASVDAYVTQGNDLTSTYSYQMSDLKASLNASLVNPDAAGAALWNHFVDNKKDIVSLHDDKRGYINYNDVKKALTDSLVAGIPFNVNTYTESAAAQISTDLPGTVSGITVVNGVIVTTDVNTGEQIGTAPVNLGTAANYAILAKTGISSVPDSVITGNIGVSPASASYITGFSLSEDAPNGFSTSTQITGKAYASDYASTTSSDLTTAVSNMETAYTDASGRAVDFTELHSGDISGQTLTAGVYKWGTDVVINTDVTLSGGPNDVFIFQVAKGITQANGTQIILSGGVQAKNIFWQTAETVKIGTTAHFEGILLCQKNISLGTGASINGRLLAQTAVTLDQSTVVAK